MKCGKRLICYAVNGLNGIVSVSPGFSLQINKEDGMVEASRIMNLYQFIQLYKDITSQAAEIFSGEAGAGGPSGQLPSTDSCQASMWMGR